MAKLQYLQRIVGKHILSLSASLSGDPVREQFAQWRRELAHLEYTGPAVEGVSVHVNIYEPFRRTEIGKCLLQTAEENLANAGVKRVVAGVNFTDTYVAPVRFFERMGYVALEDTVFPTKRYAPVVPDVRGMFMVKDLT